MGDACHGIRCIYAAGRARERMGLGDGDWFVCTVVLATLLGAHALIDAICTVATLFPNLRWSWFRYQQLTKKLPSLV